MILAIAADPPRAQVWGREEQDLRRLRAARRDDRRAFAQSTWAPRSLSDRAAAIGWMTKSLAGTTIFGGYDSPSGIGRWGIGDDNPKQLAASGGTTRGAGGRVPRRPGSGLRAWRESRPAEGTVGRRVFRHRGHGAPAASRRNDGRRRCAAATAAALGIPASCLHQARLARSNSDRRTRVARWRPRLRRGLRCPGHALCAGLRQAVPNDADVTAVFVVGRMGWSPAARNCRLQTATPRAPLRNSPCAARKALPHARSTISHQ